MGTDYVGFEGWDVGEEVWFVGGESEYMDRCWGFVDCSEEDRITSTVKLYENYEWMVVILSTLTLMAMLLWS